MKTWSPHSFASASAGAAWFAERLMSLLWPLGLLAVVPALIVAGVLLRRAGSRGRLPALLTAIGLVVLAIAIARPVATVSLPRVEGTMVLAFDNSNSMLADDAEPTRIAQAQSIAHELLDAQASTVNVGVVTFSSGGVLVQEPTTRHDLVRSSIDRLAPDGGTSLAQGMFTSLSAVVGEPIGITQEAIDAGDITLLDIGWHAGAVIVVLSDGENRNSFDPRDVAELASNAGVRVFTIGVGDTEGTTLALDGFTVATSLNERVLIDVADATGGRYFPASAGVDIDAIEDAIDLELTFRGDEVEATALVAIVGVAMMLAGAVVSMLWFGRIA